MEPNLKAVWQRNGTDVRVNNFEELVAEIKEMTKPRPDQQNRFLYRGASNTMYTLHPALARMAFEKNSPAEPKRPWMSTGMLYGIEKQVTEMFSKKANLYVGSQFLPVGKNGEENNAVHLWQLMQHHGAKTRLLDWTESPYIAAYFAVIDEPESDGVIWIVEKTAHDDRMVDQHLPKECKGRNREVTLFSSVTYRDTSEIALQSIRKHMVAVKEDEQRLIHNLYFFPCFSPNERMASQRGWFSCASVLTADHEDAIGWAFRNSSGARWATKIIITASIKSEILRALWSMNITGESLFRGLDGLGRSLGEAPFLLRPDENTQCFYDLEEGLLTVQGQNPSEIPSGMPQCNAKD